MKNLLLRINENVDNKVKILSENVDKKIQNQVLVNILAWQKSKARSRVWIVQNDVHIAETLAKGIRS